MYHAPIRWLLYISVALHFVSLWEDFCRCLEYANEHFYYMYVGKEHTLFETAYQVPYLHYGKNSIWRLKDIAPDIMNVKWRGNNSPFFLSIFFFLDYLGLYWIIFLMFVVEILLPFFCFKQGWGQGIKGKLWINSHEKLPDKNLSFKKWFNAFIKQAHKSFWNCIVCSVFYTGHFIDPNLN